jgi:heme A synthase
MLALAVWALRRYRSNRHLVLATSGGFVLILAQAGLGGATVEHDLNPGLVAAHLGLAMLLLGVLLYVIRLCRPSIVDSPAFPRWLAIAATAAVFCTIVAGGYMAGTQKYGRPDYTLGDGAHHACGKQFPTCNGGFMPFGESRLVNIHLTHRAFMYLASILLIALITVALRRRVAVRFARLLIALLVAQILVGALNVWLDEYEALIVLHLALGTLLWAAALGFTLQLSPARERAPSARAVPA